MTPVPGGLARPLVESLVHEVVCDEHDIAEHVPDPPDGLIGFDRAVQLALRRVHDAAVSTRWSSAAVPGAPSDPLPSDPDWAGGSLFVDERQVTVDAVPRRAVARCSRRSAASAAGTRGGSRGASAGWPTGSSAVRGCVAAAATRCSCSWTTPSTSGASRRSRRAA